MKKMILVMSISFLLIVAAACGSNEIDGKVPADIPVEWANAQIQNDQSTMLDLLDEKTKALDSETKADSNETIKHYKLTEWKASDEQYYYDIEYQDPTEDNKVEIEKMEVIKTDNGWKRTKYSNLQNFDKLVEDLEPEVLREMHDE